jgi:phosphoesterase RecJ-like protein
VRVFTDVHSLPYLSIPSVQVLKKEDIDRALVLLKKAKRLCCMCHRNPDGDAIGSITGAAELLTLIAPDTPVKLYCTDPSPPLFSYLSWTARIEQEMNPTEGDVFVFLDCADPKLTEYHERFPQIFGGTWPSICFDHHETNKGFGTVNFVIPDAASTCEILVAFADEADIVISPETATCLLTGVYTDTGGLLHSNTTPRVYRTVAKLLRAGARHQTMTQSVFRTAQLSTLRLWGRVLEKINVTDEGGAISALTESDFRATGAAYSELTGAIDYVNAVPGMRFSLVLTERGGKVKGSLRTLRDDVDVAKMAATFQGGGHRKAAGFAVEGKLVPEMRWKVQKEEVSSKK